MQILGCKKRGKKSEKWGTTASKSPATLRAGAMGKTPPYLVGESSPADTGQFPCRSEKTLPMEAQIRGSLPHGSGSQHCGTPGTGRNPCFQVFAPFFATQNLHQISNPQKISFGNNSGDILCYVC